MSSSEIRPTIRDIARKAGCHYSTVSLALRNHPRIPPETKERIREIAGQLGYRTDAMLAALCAYREMKRPDTIVEEVFEAVAGDLPFESGDKVGLMINGLGGTPISELYVLYRRAAQLSQKRGLEVVRNYVGNYCTSLEMAGMSLTLIRLDDEIDSLLSAPAEIPLRIF